MAVIAMDMTYPRLLLGAVNKKSMKKINRYARRDSNDRQSWYSYGDVLKYYERKWCFKVVFFLLFFYLDSHPDHNTIHNHWGNVFPDTDTTL